MRCACLFALLAGIGLQPGFAADLRPSWECLPAETVAVVRLPRPAAVLEAARKQTRFGAVTLSPERMEKAWELIAPRLWPADDAQAESDADTGAARLDTTLGRYGLTIADVSAGFSGDAGAGLVVNTRGDGLPPLAVVIAWIEPGAETTARLLAAVKQAAEEAIAEGDEPAVRRIDVTMAGHDVVWLAQPVMRREVSISERRSSCFGLISFDADRFNTFNDNHGHDAGDMVLRAIGAKLTEIMTAGEICCRFGGEEFAVLVPAANLEETAVLAERLREAVHLMQVRYMDGYLSRVSISVGVAAYPVSGVQPHDILRRADEALYRAKEGGRNRVVMAKDG